MLKSLLFSGNLKTGTPIALFNLPRVLTCPGATDVCQKHCYAQKSSKRFPGSDPSHQLRYEASLRPDFVEVMVADIIRSKTKFVRIHSSGDFYSAAYIAKWIKIIQKTPDVVYYAYTHSWRCPGLIRRLDYLRRLPNMQLWWSADSDTVEPPEGLTAYMAVTDEDVPDYEVSMIFRVLRKKKCLKIGGFKVCPLESGRPELKAGGMTCASCKLCFSNALDCAPVAPSKV